jgi:multicomponent K+:H+ antiporter subunit G
MTDAVVSLLLVLGAGFALVGSFALARFGDFGKRLHGPSKASTLGVGAVLAASALWFGVEQGALGHELLVVVFLFATAPVAAHLLVQAALHDDAQD